MDLERLVAEMMAADEAIDRRQEKVRRASLNGTLDDFLASEEEARSKSDGDSDRASESGDGGDAIRIVDVMA